MKTHNETQKTVTRVALTILTFAAIAFNIGCSSGSSNNGSSAAAASAITVTPNPETVALSSSVLIQPTGGTAPYTFVLSSSLNGTLSLPSGTYTVYNSSTTSGTALLTITDSSSPAQTVSISIIVGTGTGTGTGSIIPTSTGSVIPGGALVFTSTGGNGVYTYTVISPVTGGGSFVGATYYAPSTAQTVEIEVTDTLGNTGTAAVIVSSTATSSACEGTYSMSLESVSAVLTLVADSSGNIAGTLNINGGIAGLLGTCSGGVIRFTNEYSGSVFTGTYNLNTSGTVSSMSGTFNDTSGNTDPWIAVHQ